MFMEAADLGHNVQHAQSLANLQHSGAVQSRFSAAPLFPDPGAAQLSKISPEDLAVLKERFPMLCDFSDQVLQSRTTDELLRIESTRIRIKDAERSRETEDRLASNKAGLLTKFYEVKAGRDNRCAELHPARYLPGAACSAVRQYITARDVLGLSAPPPLGCYDMNAVGMGGFVQPRGWLELGSTGSSKLKISQFNINNVTRSSKSTDADSGAEMKSVGEFIKAIRTLRESVGRNGGFALLPTRSRAEALVLESRST